MLKKSLGLLLLVAAPFAGSVNADVPKNIVNFAIQQEPPQLDSTKATDQQSIFVLGHIKEGLVSYGKAGEVIPGVAEKWKVTDKEVVFNLRKNSKWSNGKPVTAKDFVFAWKKALEPKNASEYAFFLYPIKNAEAVNKGTATPDTLGVSTPDDYTIKIELEKPCAYFVSLTGFPTFLPVNEEFYNEKAGKYGSEAENLIANGAFILTKWVHGAALTLDKNPSYWNKAAIAVDRIDIPYVTTDNSALFNFFKDKKIDVVERLGKEDLAKAQAEKFKMRNYADGSVWFLEYNFREGKITRNRNLRKAIQAVFNPEEFVTKVVSIPGTKPARGLIPSWVAGVKDTFRKEFVVPNKKPDLAAAKKYLEAAKKELGGVIPPLVWLTSDTPLAARESEYFQNLLKSTLGLEIRIDKQIFKQRLAKMSSGEFDIVSAGWGPDYSDPMTFADLMTTWNENNRGKFDSAEYDKLIREAQATSNQKKRMEAMAAAEKIALEEQAIMPTYERTVVYLVNDRVQGVVRRAIGPDPDFHFAKLAK